MCRNSSLLKTQDAKLGDPAVESPGFWAGGMGYGIPIKTNWTQPIAFKWSLKRNNCLQTIADKMIFVLQDWQEQSTSSLTYSVLQMQDSLHFSCRKQRTVANYTCTAFVPVVTTVIRCAFCTLSCFCVCFLWIYAVNTLTQFLLSTSPVCLYICSQTFKTSFSWLEKKG